MIDRNKYLPEYPENEEEKTCPEKYDVNCMQNVFKKFALMDRNGSYHKIIGMT